MQKKPFVLDSNNVYEVFSRIKRLLDNPAHRPGEVILFLNIINYARYSGKGRPKKSDYFTMKETIGLF